MSSVTKFRSITSVITALLVLFVALVLPHPAYSQGSTTIRPTYELSTVTFTGNTTSVCFGPVTDGVAYWSMRILVTGAVTAGTIKLGGSQTRVSNSTCGTITDIIAAQDVTMVAAVNGSLGVYRYVQLEFAGYAGTGNIRVTVFGDKSSTAIGSAVTVTSGNITVSDGAGALNVICDSGCSGGTQYTEDAAAAANPVGTAMNLVRADTPAGVASADGDNVAARGGNFGNMYVTLLDSAGAFIPTSSGGVGASDANTTRTIGSQQLPFRSLDLDETEEEVKATAGELCMLVVTNTATATRWVKVYNATAASVVVGTTTPTLTFGIPGNTSDDVMAGFAGGNGCLQFSTAITLAATTGVADADTGAPGANDVVVNAGYR